MSNKEYLLGTNKEELDRLEFQHGVWRKTTNDFFDRLGVGKGWHCLDAGAGPGFVAEDLRERVGESGSVTALEPSKMFLDVFVDKISEKGWTNVRTINSGVEEANLPEKKYDLIFARWVIDFVADPYRFFTSLLPSLKPNGIIAFQDYYYEGLSLFPRGGAFDDMPKFAKAYYASVGGDPYLPGKLPAWFKKHHLTTIDYTPHVFAGGPESPIYEWGHRFYSKHIQHMVDKKAATQEEGDALLADWMAHYNNPDAIFFSPMVVDVAGRAIEN